VLETTCTSSGNKQKVRRFRKDCVSTLCVELNCENCKEFADHPFRVTHRTNVFTVYSACQTKLDNELCNRTCVFIRSTYVHVPNAKSKQVTCWHAIFIPYSRFSHTIFIESVFTKIKDSITVKSVNSDINHLKFNSLKFLLACNWRYISLESFTQSKLSDVEITCLPKRTLHDVNSHVCGGYSGRCLFSYFQCSTVNICTKGNICNKNLSCFSSKL